MNKRDQLFMTFGSIALIAAAGVGGYVIFKPASAQTTPTVATSSLSQSSTQSSSDTSSVTLGSSSTASTTTNSSASYKDGTYTSSTSYQVPHGNTNSIKVTVVVSVVKLLLSKQTTRIATESQGDTSVTLKARCQAMRMARV